MYSRPSFRGNHGNLRVNRPMSPEDDKSSLEAAAEAAAKVNAMLIAKGMLRPNQVQAGTSVVTKKNQGGSSNSNLIVSEVEINDLTTPCRNTLTRGTTQEEISKASGAAVTTRGRFMKQEEKIQNPRERCLYLNIQASTQDSVDVAVKKIQEIIRSMNGRKNEHNRNFFGNNSNRGGNRPPPRMANHHNSNQNPGQNTNQNQSRFPPGIQFNQIRGPRPLMSLPSPPPMHPQMPPPIQIQAQQTVTVLQEKLYIGLEHAPPNFDTKGKILGPGGAFLGHIQGETGAYVSLRGKASGFEGNSTSEPMHVHIEHPSLPGLAESKKLAENLIQTVQQSYVSFQQALAALPPAMPTGLITGLHQQPQMLEPQQMNLPPPTIATITSLPEPQTMQATLQPQVQQVGPTQMLLPAGSVPTSMPCLPQQGLVSHQGQPQLVMPQSMALTNVTLVSSQQPGLMQQPPPMELGQQPVLLSQGAPPPQHLVPMATPLQPLGPPQQAMAFSQPTMQLVSQAPPTGPPPPTLMQQQGPPMMHQAPQQMQAQPQPQPAYSAPYTSVMYSVAPTNTNPYYSTPKPRRFTEEKDDKIPENLLGYQHGPPHLVNLVRSSPPPQQLVQGPPPGMIMSHISQEGQILQPGQQILQPMMTGPPPEAQQLLHAPPQHLAPQHHMAPQGPPHMAPQVAPGHHPLPPAHHMMPQSGPSPSHQARQSPGAQQDNRPPSRGPPHSSSSLMPPPPPPTNQANGEPNDEGNPQQQDNPWENGQKRRGGSRQHQEEQPEKKKLRGILKNKQQFEPSEDKADVDDRQPEHPDEAFHPASPQYQHPHQGPPLRYPTHPSDPNLPPSQQEPQHHPLPPGHPGHPGHPGVMQIDMQGHHQAPLHTEYSLQPPQMHFAPQQMHMEGPRMEAGPPGQQIVMEHPGHPGAPQTLITHHRVQGPNGQIHIEQGAPRQVVLEHGTLLEQPAMQAPHGQQPQEMYEFEATHQVPPAPPQYQNFEHVPASQPPHMMAPPPNPVVVSAAPPQHNVAISSAGPFHSQPPQYSHSLPPPTQQFQPAGYQPAPHLVQQQPPAHSQYQPHQPQANVFWVSQA